MKRFIFQHKILSLILLVPALLLGALLFYEFAGRPIGFVLANVDQLRGRNRIKLIGEPVFVPGYFELLDEKYKVKADRVAYCLVGPWEKGFSSGYNSVSVPAIEKKFGRNVFDECYREALTIRLKEPGLSEATKQSLESALPSLQTTPYREQ